MDTLTSVLLPDFGGARSWRRAGPVIAPAERLPACAPAPQPGADWHEERVDVDSYDFVGTVVLRLPPGWRITHPTPDTRWYRSPLVLAGSSESRQSVAVMPVGRQHGYRGSGFDSTTRQIALAECETDRPTTGTALVSFETVGQFGHRWHLEAVSSAGAWGWVRSRTTTEDQSYVPTLRAIFASVRVEAP